MNEVNQTELKPGLTSKEAIERFVHLFTQIESYNEDLKEVKDACKDSGLNAALLASVAKAIVQNKLGDLQSRSTAILDLIEEIDG